MEPTSDLHITLPDTMLYGVDRLARERGVRRVNVIREAVAMYLAQVEADELSKEMQAYVDKMADRSGEFCAETEEHTVERLLRETEW